MNANKKQNERKCRTTNKNETRQKNCISHRSRKKNCTSSKKAELGFRPILQELRFIVQNFVNINDIATLFMDGMPGYEWTVKFMDRHNLALKKGLMQLAKKSITSDPFVIYGFYELLEAEVKRLRLEYHAECIWNCDEMGFPKQLIRLSQNEAPDRMKYEIHLVPKDENVTIESVIKSRGKPAVAKMRHQRSENELKWMEVY